MHALELHLKGCVDDFLLCNSDIQIYYYPEQIKLHNPLKQFDHCETNNDINITRSCYSVFGSTNFRELNNAAMMSFHQSSFYIPPQLIQIEKPMQSCHG